MKTQMHKAAFLKLAASALVLVAGFTVGSASAAPIEGSFNMSPTDDATGWEPLDGDDNTVASFDDAVTIDFLPNEFEVSDRKGDFATLLSAGAEGTIQDLTFDPFDAAPLENFWEIDGVSFTLESITEIMTGSNSLAVSGTGTIFSDDESFDPTPGIWSFSGDTPGGFENFNWSASQAATAVPEPTTITLLGGLLLALGLMRRMSVRAH